MKVFLSWSGERSRQLAMALRDWFPMVLQHVHVWMSERDIPAGERWATEIGRELEASSYGIICLTRENLHAPWVLFEAGALARSLSESAVCPLLLGADFADLTGSPLTQFQAKKVTREGIREILHSVNSRSEQALHEAVLTRIFEALWPKLYEALETIPPAIAPPSGTPARPRESEVLEELVATVRRVEWRMGDFEKMLAGKAGGAAELKPVPEENPRFTFPFGPIRARAQRLAEQISVERFATLLGMSPEHVQSVLDGEMPQGKHHRVWIDWYLLDTRITKSLEQ